ncbi:MAG: 2-oxo acid dehydrogenase subunit E2 [Bacteroidales bacterium]|nr:2-oxo acid dehydrogenase subunit E2 [Bacteroidales bacterium]
MNTSDTLNSEWRKIAATIYKKPTDSKIYGQADIDVTDLEKFISEKRKDGLKITLTHVFVSIISRGLKSAVPELNCFVRRGKFVARPSVDAMVSVLKADGEMGSVKVQHADTLNLAAIEEILKKEINKSRKGDENKTMQSKNILASIPWPFRNWFFGLYSTLTLNWGVSIPFLGLSANSFGSFLLTNIGSIGLDTGFPALLPSANIPFVMVMGGIKKKPVVINDNIVIRRIMSLTVVMDHRITDASQAGRLLRFLKQQMSHPEELL